VLDLRICITYDEEVATTSVAGTRHSGHPTVRNYWHPVAASAEVGEQPRRVTLLGQDLVVFRHQDGVSVFDDVCIHRGTALSLGWITEGRLTCAYHGWQYDRTGACVRIPALPEGAPIPRKACATVRRSDEAYGLVWVALDEPCAPIPQFPNGEWEDREYRGFLALSYQWKTSAGRAVENFMDFSHFPFVHEGLLGSGDRTVVEPHEIVETDYGFSYSFQQEEPSTVHSAEDEVVTWEYYLYRPFTIHLKKRTSDGNATLISMAAAPSAEDHTHMWVWIVRNYDKDPSEDQRFADFSNTIMEQDRVVVESQRPERIPVDLREELHLKVPDASGIAFRRMLSTIAQVAPFMP
jgi:phenylpropionate dioxygenase-like ring-hydroxylating dioxygenase large terminal subunit